MPTFQRKVTTSVFKAEVVLLGNGRIYVGLEEGRLSEWMNQRCAPSQQHEEGNGFPLSRLWKPVSSDLKGGSLLPRT